MDFAEKIRRLLVDLNAIDYTEFTGPMTGFSKVKDEVAEMFQIAKDLGMNRDVLARIPGEAQVQVEGFLQQFLKFVREMQRLSYSNQFDNTTRLAEDVRKLHNLASENLFPLLKSLLYEKESPNQQAEDLVKEAEEQLSAIKEQKERMGAALNEAQAMSAGEGVDNFSDAFRKQAGINDKAAKNWRTGAIISAAIIVLCFSGLILWPAGTQNTLYGFLQVAIPRILLASFLWAIFHQVVKNHNANMHLYTLNKHRENCMDSFMALYRAGKAPEVRDAVLLQATKAIFEAGETGYVSSKGSGNTSVAEPVKLVTEPLAKEQQTP